MAFRYEHDGFCPCCETRQTFVADSEWFRDSLLCPNCGSVVRERAVALILREILPDWRNCAIHESSPASRGLSARMPREARGYVATHFFPDEPMKSWKGKAPAFGRQLKTLSPQGVERLRSVAISTSSRLGHLAMKLAGFELDSRDS